MMDQNFYAVNDDQKMQFHFTNTYPTNQNKSKRPQSANIRITKNSASKSRGSRRNKNNPEMRYSAEEGFTQSSVPEYPGEYNPTVAYREPPLTNPSQLHSSPSKFQK